ncbi:unnamed protein product [Arabis nemorensis]|uniref:Uncharacterized protein n=1 Tax=Arabis nemorensis TaxID=586526 RepID=A0A565BCY0_9BRAS|nr:unnamed protein product [Arabis nemorensis]
MDSIEQKSAARTEAISPQRKDDAVEQENDVPPQAKELLGGKVVSPKSQDPIAAVEKKEEVCNCFSFIY